VKLKKELIESCKNLVDSLKENERDLAEECRKIHKDADDAVEMDRRLFRSGQEDRLQKVG
jgi:hypothetical protein